MSGDRTAAAAAESGGTLQLDRRARGRGARPYEGRDVTAVGPRLVSCATIEDLIWRSVPTSGARVIVRIKAGLARKCDHKEKRIRRLLHEADLYSGMCHTSWP